MKLLSLEMRNFGPYKGRQSVNFPSRMDQNVMIVKGVNTRGKTSFLNAIRWCLYGKAIGRHSREIGLQNLLNSESLREGDFEVSVSLEFEANGSQYLLQRRASKKALVSSPDRPEDFDVSVALRKDSSVVPSVMISHEINRIAPEQVSRFFLFDGELLEEYENLLFEGNREGEKIKDAIEQVLGVPAMLMARKDIGILLSNFKDAQTRDLKQVDATKKLADRQSQLQEEMSAMYRDLESQQANLLKKQSERDDLSDEIERLQSVYETAAEINSQKALLAEIKNEIEQIELERSEDFKNLWRSVVEGPVERRLQDLRTKQSGLLKDLLAAEGIRSKIAEYEALISNLTCPTCGQGVERADRSDWEREISKLRVEIEDLSSDKSVGGLAALSTEMDVLSRISVPGLKDRLLRQSRSYDSKLVKKVGYTLAIEKLETEIDGYDTQDLARKRNRKVSLDKEEERLRIEIDNVKGRIEKLETEIGVLNRSIALNPSAGKSSNTPYVNVFQELQSLFGESISSLRDNLRSHVQKNASEAFIQLISQKEYASLSINENYGLSIIDKEGHKIAVRSAGAEQIVALSLIHGLSNTGRSANFIVMDTPFGRLDQFHRNSILSFLPKTTGQLILLVHDGEIRSDEDLAPLSPRIGAYYEIEYKSHTHSEIRARHSTGISK